MSKAALILAAGKNTRFDTGIPKSMHQVGDASLLERHIRAFHKNNIHNLAVVTGFRAEIISEYVGKLNRNLDYPVELIHNSEYEKANGLSIRVARDWIESLSVPHFFCTMSDHLFSSNFYETAIGKAMSTQTGDILLKLAVDRPSQHNSYIDMEDVTRVKCTLNSDLLMIEQVGKLINDYNYFDTGFFILYHDVFDQLDYCVSIDRNSISDLVNHLAVKQQALAIDVTGSYWNDVDTPADFETVKHQLHML
jgi:choline kinase